MNEAVSTHTHVAGLGGLAAGGRGYRRDDLCV